MKIILLILMSFFVLNNVYCSKDDKNKKTELAKGEVLILGLVEYDFSELENKNISGILLYIDTKGKLSYLKFPNSSLPKNKYKQYDFISVKGKGGDYALEYKKNNKHSSETENLLSVMDMEKDPSSRESSTLQNYKFKSGNIINLGKITIKYIGGQAEDGRIKYSYTIEHNKQDTMMLDLLKNQYPEIYTNHQDDIYDLYNEFEECIFHIVNNVSEEKSKIILQFIIDHPDKLSKVFANLTPQSQKQVTSMINEFTEEELHQFLNSKD